MKEKYERNAFASIGKPPCNIRRHPWQLGTGLRYHRESASTQIAAYGLFVIASIGAAITFLTGEPAEGAVEGIAGVSERVIERHEDTAGIALAALVVLGVTSLTALYLTIRKSSLTGRIAWIAFGISIVSSVLIARTGYLGGQIRHTELNTTATTIEQPADDYD